MKYQRSLKNFWNCLHVYILYVLKWLNIFHKTICAKCLNVRFCIIMHVMWGYSCIYIKFAASYRPDYTLLQLYNIRNIRWHITIKSQKKRLSIFSVTMIESESYVWLGFPCFKMSFLVARESLWRFNQRAGNGGCEFCITQDRKWRMTAVLFLLPALGESNPKWGAGVQDWRWLVYL